MAMDLSRPWMELHGGGSAHQPERYVLRAIGAGVDGGYLGIAPISEAIEPVRDLDRAWVFHTHQGAVHAAREVAAVYGQPVDVVKLR
jgi:hypothetical protein